MFGVRHVAEYRCAVAKMDTLPQWIGIRTVAIVALCAVAIVALCTVALVALCIVAKTNMLQNGYVSPEDLYTVAKVDL